MLQRARNEIKALDFVTMAQNPKTIKEKMGISEYMKRNKNFKGKI